MPLFSLLPPCTIRGIFKTSNFHYFIPIAYCLFSIHSFFSSGLFPSFGPYPVFFTAKPNILTPISPLSLFLSHFLDSLSNLYLPFFYTYNFLPVSLTSTLNPPFFSSTSFHTCNSPLSPHFPHSFLSSPSSLLPFSFLAPLSHFLNVCPMPNHVCTLYM